MVGQYGHEDSTPAYVTTLRDVFREARRVLAEPGTASRKSSRSGAAMSWLTPRRTGMRAARRCRTPFR